MTTITELTAPVDPGRNFPFADFSLQEKATNNTKTKNNEAIYKNISATSLATIPGELR